MEHFKRGVSHPLHVCTLLDHLHAYDYPRKTKLSDPFELLVMTCHFVPTKMSADPPEFVDQQTLAKSLTCT
eukprot:jgi/Botrbrau1/14316/Bobra.0287s0009.1